MCKTFTQYSFGLKLTRMNNVMPLPDVPNVTYPPENSQLSVDNRFLGLVVLG